MDCRSPYTKAWYFTLLLAVAWPAAAQESVIFTHPADLPTGKANDFLGNQHQNPGSLNAPGMNFGSKSGADFDVLPGAPKPRSLSPEEIKAWQKFTDTQKNWMLLPPEEIMGVPTPEQIMGLPDPNHEENLTTEERYMNRQERQRNFSATNALGRADNLLRPGDDSSDPKNSDPRKYRSERRQELTAENQPTRGLFGPPLSQDPARNAPALWHSAFAEIPALPKPDPEQEAAMDRFRAMMEPPAPDKLPSLSALAPAPAPAPDPNLNRMPDFNPAGRSYVPVQNTAGRPMGINPLPTITGQLPSQSAPKPKPLVQPPPWMSDKPAPGKPILRKF